MSEKRKAGGISTTNDVNTDKKAKSSGAAAPKAEETDSSKQFDNIEEDDEFQEFEVYSKCCLLLLESVRSAPNNVIANYIRCVLSRNSVADWDKTKTQNPDSLDFQDNWDEDANDKDFVAQLRKELGK